MLHHVRIWPLTNISLRDSKALSRNFHGPYKGHYSDATIFFNPHNMETPVKPEKKRNRALPFNFLQTQPSSTYRPFSYDAFPIYAMILIVCYCVWPDMFILLEVEDMWDKSSIFLSSRCKVDKAPLNKYRYTWLLLSLLEINVDFLRQRRTPLLLYFCASILLASAFLITTCRLRMAEVGYMTSELPENNIFFGTFKL